MKRKIGITGEHLKNSYPRGVQKVADGISRELLNRSDIEVIVIKNIKYIYNDLVVEYEYLEEFISKKKQDQIIKNDNRISKINIWNRRYSLAKYIYTKSFRYIGGSSKIRLLILHPIGKIIKTINMRQQRNVTYQNTLTQSSNYIMIELLDAIISFECFEDIWEWPWELYKCKIYGFVHDLIPFRIHEGPDHRPEIYLKKLSLMTVRANKLFCNSRSTKDDLEEYIPSSKNKAKVIYLGHDLDISNNKKMSSKIDNKTFTIIFVGTIDLRKNYHGFMSGLFMFRTRARDINIHVKIAGHNPNRSQFLDIDARAEAQNINISWLGYIDTSSLTELYQKADMLVYLSLWEGFGIPILEAMSAGIPVLTSSLSSMPEVGGKCVFYADPYDPGDISNKLEKIFMMDSVTRYKLVNDGIERAKQFTWKRCVDTILSEIYFDEI